MGGGSDALGCDVHGVIPESFVLKSTEVIDCADEAKARCLLFSAAAAPNDHTRSLPSVWLTLTVDEDTPAPELILLVQVPTPMRL